jgi:precorrin-6Y C5,15-methyltransferase (decarboxylating)
MASKQERGAWLSVVGIGEDGYEGLNPRARGALDGAECLVGGRRHLALLPEDGRPRISWRSPLAGTIGEIARWRGRPTAVLASGDPLWHGVGRLLTRSFGNREVAVLPGVSAVQLSAARLHWPLEEVAVVSLHGRPLDRLRRLLAPGARLLVLTSDGAAPAAIAGLLVAMGLGPARLLVLERLGGPAERVVEGTADGLEGEFAPLNLVAIECPKGPGPTAAVAVPGLPDEAYDHDGQLTKREVRAATLAALAPCEGELLWDIGAGAGSIAIEWLRAGSRMRAVAIERDPARAARIRTNGDLLGVPELELVESAAPACLAGLPKPDAVFVGGGVAVPGLLKAAFGALPGGGRLVANAVTIEGEAALLAFRAAHGGSLTRIAIARAESAGTRLAWRALAPVTQLLVTKTCGAAS